MATRRSAALRAIPEGSYVEWSAVIAGAIGAAAISFLLLTFGGSIGLTLTSPYAGASIFATVIAVAWWAVIVQIGSFFVGGYLAGRMRAGWGDPTDETQFRDSAHGFLVWALGVMVGALLLAMTGGAMLKTAVDNASTVASGAMAGDSNGSSSPVDYAVDNLLRPAPRGTITSAPNPALRDEAKRIFAATIENRELTAADRDYLSDLIAARTGLTQADAQRRVDQSVETARTLEAKAMAATDKARKVGVLTGFLAAASLLISLAAAVGGARLGGLHRDDRTTAHLFGHRFW